MMKNKSKIFLKNVVLIRYVDQIKIGRYAALLSIFVVLLMPLWVFLVPGAFVETMRSGEYGGFTIVYLIGSCLLHLPICILLYVLACAIKSNRLSTAFLIHYALFVGLGLSAVYYYAIFHKFPWLRFGPGLIYFLVLVPLVSQGLSGALNREMAAKSSEAALEVEGGEPMEALAARAKTEKLRVIFNLIVDRATVIGGEKGLRILKAATENPYQVQEALAHARDSYHRVKEAMNSKEK